jgi:hypothetical protein
MIKEEIVDLAKQVGKDTMQDMVLFMKKDMNLEYFLLDRDVAKEKFFGWL